MCILRVYVCLQKEMGVCAVCVYVSVCVFVCVYERDSFVIVYVERK